ncbi:MAG: hypothetical protein WCL34_07500 [Methylococcaceae bacterium]
MKKVILSLAVLIYSTGSFAACTKAGIVGTWKVRMPNSSMPGGIMGKCEFIVQKDGKLKNSSCEKAQYMPSMDKNPYPVIGNLTVGSSCDVIGTIKIDKTSDDYSSSQELVLEGDLNNKGNDVLIGTLKSISQDPTYMDKDFYAIKIK